MANQATIDKVNQFLPTALADLGQTNFDELCQRAEDHNFNNMKIRMVYNKMVDDIASGELQKA